jgi:hypothetical protein
MKINIQVLQDEDDIKNGTVQLAVQENSRCATQYFSLEEWEAFKKYCNEWVPSKKVEYENNPLTQADYCNINSPFEVDMYFGGSLFNINLYFTSRSLWLRFKKIINAFKVERSVM